MNMLKIWSSVTETNSFSKASAILDSLQPDIILLEFDLQINGLFSFLTQIKKMNPNSKIIALYIRYKNNHLKLNNISDVDYLFDKYEEFEKIPGAIKEIIANNEKNSYIY